MRERGEIGSREMVGWGEVEVVEKKDQQIYVS
jgi:hypothetical protein